MLLTGCNSEEGSGSVTVKSGSAVTLERIDITPSPLRTRGVSQLQLAAGNELPFHAIGHYSDGSSRTLMGLSVNGLSESDTHLSDWHTSEQEVAVFSAPGMLKGGKTPGLVKVNLIKDNITSNTVKVNVTAAVIEDITITPASIALAKGQTEPLTAMATYSDGTTSDVTTSVAWQSPSPSTANVTPTGLISGADVGITTITATKDGVPSNTVNVHVTTAVIDDITITPANVSVAKGQTQPLTATAIYSDGSSSNITSSVAWQSDSPSTATPTVTITPTGVLSGVDVGTANLSATKDGVPSNTVNVNVTAAVIEDITITPASIALAKGQTEPLTAMATYSDGTTSDVTTSVAWQSPSPSTANVTPTGLISGGDVGITTITATKDGVPSNTVNVHVTTAVIDDITITPANVSVAKGQTQPLTATAIYSDGSSSNITNSVAWQSDSPSTATPTVTITPTGVLSGVDVGTANLSATKDGVPSNTVNVNVTAAVIEGITITPASIALAKGQTEPLTAMATYSDGTTSDVTTSVAWQS
ncbi:Ig-like domain-containing protein, partial [Vibrio ostreicida]|uniref:Ig-like domain-containing protein n=1 Tax=Vibrio ostreicida TaxID=526588 RepID=UPI001495398E